MDHAKRENQPTLHNTTSDVFRPFGRPVYQFGCSKNIFQVFFFQLYFNKKFAEVAVNDFIMPLIILKWLRIKNADRKEKQWDKAVVVKERTVNETVFIHVTT